MPTVERDMTSASPLPQATLDAYFDGIGRLLRRPEQRANFALYAVGLLSALERKSVEPIASLAAGGDNSHGSVGHA